MLAGCGAPGVPESPSAASAGTTPSSQAIASPRASRSAQPTASARPTRTPKPRPTEAVPPAEPVGPTVTAVVTRIVDGDTIQVAIGGRLFKLRYIGINAPESVDPNSPVEPFGREASAANSALVRGKTVILERDVSDVDEYGRLLRYVWLRSGNYHTMVNFVLVSRGYAHAARHPPDVRYADVFRGAERDARNAGRGLWGLPASPSPT